MIRAQQPGELIGSRQHCTHTSQRGTDRRDVGCARGAYIAPDCLTYPACHDERFGDAEAAVEDQDGGPVVRQLLGAVHGDLPPHRQER